MQENLEQFIKSAKIKTDNAFTNTWTNYCDLELNSRVTKLLNKSKKDIKITKGFSFSLDLEIIVRNPKSPEFVWNIQNNALTHNSVQKYAKLIEDTLWPNKKITQIHLNEWADPVSYKNMAITISKDFQDLVSTVGRAIEQMDRVSLIGWNTLNFLRVGTAAIGVGITISVNLLTPVGFHIASVILGRTNIAIHALLSTIELLYLLIRQIRLDCKEIGLQILKK